MGLKVYSDKNGKGNFLTFSEGQRYVGDAWNDRISSLEVTTAGERWIVYTDSQYKGVSYGPFTAPGIYNCHDYFENDAISSVYKMAPDEAIPDATRTPGEIHGGTATVDDDQKNLFQQGAETVGGLLGGGMNLFQQGAETMGGLLEGAADLGGGIFDFIMELVKKIKEEVEKKYKQIKWTVIIGVIAYAVLFCLFWGTIIYLVIKYRREIWEAARGTQQQIRDMQMQQQMQHMQLISSLVPAIGTGVGMYAGGPMGAAAGNQIGTQVQQSGALTHLGQAPAPAPSGGIESAFGLEGA